MHCIHVHTRPDYYLKNYNNCSVLLNLQELLTIIDSLMQYFSFLVFFQVTMVGFLSSNTLNNLCGHEVAINFFLCVWIFISIPVSSLI